MNYTKALQRNKEEDNFLKQANNNLVKHERAVLSFARKSELDLPHLSNVVTKTLNIIEGIERDPVKFITQKTEIHQQRFVSKYHTLSKIEEVLSREFNNYMGLVKSIENQISWYNKFEAIGPRYSKILTDFTENVESRRNEETASLKEMQKDIKERVSALNIIKQEFMQKRNTYIPTENIAEELSAFVFDRKSIDDSIMGFVKEKKKITAFIDAFMDSSKGFKELYRVFRSSEYLKGPEAVEVVRRVIPQVESECRQLDSEIDSVCNRYNVLINRAQTLKDTLHKLQQTSRRNMPELEKILTIPKYIAQNHDIKEFINTAKQKAYANFSKNGRSKIAKLAASFGIPVAACALFFGFGTKIFNNSNAHVPNADNSSAPIIRLVDSEQQNSIGIYRFTYGNTPVAIIHYVLTERNADKLKGVPKRYILASAQLREHLQKLYDAGFRPVSVQEYIKKDFRQLPPGTNPILLTLDDACEGQIDYIRGPDGAPMLDPDCFASILQEFSNKYSDFRMTAGFAVDWANKNANGYEAPFCQPEFVKEKLQFILNKGMEIYNHGFGHINYAEASIQEMIDDMGKAMQEFEKPLGYRAQTIRTFVLPYGALPSERGLRAMRKFTYNGKVYENDLIMKAWDGTAKDAYLDDPFLVNRIEWSETTLTNLIANKKGLYTVPMTSE